MIVSWTMFGNCSGTRSTRNGLMAMTTTRLMIAERQQQLDRPTARAAAMSGVERRARLQRDRRRRAYDERQRQQRQPQLAPDEPVDGSRPRTTRATAARPPTPIERCGQAIVGLTGYLRFPSFLNASMFGRASPCTTTIVGIGAALRVALGVDASRRRRPGHLGRLLLGPGRLHQAAQAEALLLRLPRPSSRPSCPASPCRRPARPRPPRRRRSR